MAVLFIFFFDFKSLKIAFLKRKEEEKGDELRQPHGELWQKKTELYEIPNKDRKSGRKRNHSTVVAGTNSATLKKVFEVWMRLFYVNEVHDCIINYSLLV